MKPREVPAKTPKIEDKTGGNVRVESLAPCPAEGSDTIATSLVNIAQHQVFQDLFISKNPKPHLQLDLNKEPDQTEEETLDPNISFDKTLRMDLTEHFQSSLTVSKKLMYSQSCCTLALSLNHSAYH